MDKLSQVGFESAENEWESKPEAKKE